MTTLKVFRITAHVRINGRWSDRQHECVIATTSRAKAAAAVGVTSGHFAKFGGITGNARDIAAAMAFPETLLTRPVGATDRALAPLKGVAK